MDISNLSASVMFMVDETIDGAVFQLGSNLFLNFIFVGQLISLVVKCPRLVLACGEYIIEYYSKDVTQMIHIVRRTADRVDLLFLIFDFGKQIVGELRIGGQEPSCSVGIFENDRGQRCASRAKALETIEDAGRDAYFINAVTIQIDYGHIIHFTT